MLPFLVFMFVAGCATRVAASPGQINVVPLGSSDESKDCAVSPDSSMLQSMSVTPSQFSDKQHSPHGPIFSIRLGPNDEEKTISDEYLVKNVMTNEKLFGLEKSIPSYDSQKSLQEKYSFTGQQIRVGGDFNSCLSLKGWGKAISLSKCDSEDKAQRWQREPWGQGNTERIQSLSDQSLCITAHPRMKTTCKPESWSPHPYTCYRDLVFADKCQDTENVYECATKSSSDWHSAKCDQKWLIEEVWPNPPTPTPTPLPTPMPTPMPTHEFCVEIVTGGEPDNNGFLQGKIDGEDVVTESAEEFIKNSIVGTWCYTHKVVVELSNPWKNAWAGKVMASDDGNETWQSMQCTNGCGKGNEAKTDMIVVDGPKIDSKNQAAVTCEKGPCSLYWPH